MRARRFALLVPCVLIAACAARTPTLEIPNLAAMQRESVDTVDITLGPAALGFAGWLSRFGGDHDPDSGAALSLLRGLHTVQVRHFQFAADHTYRRADLEALRSQLTAPVWRHVVQVRDGGTQEDVDIYCVLEDHTVTRLVILAVEPREFTLVNIAGSLDPAQIERLRHGFVAHGHSRPIWALTPSDGEPLSQNR